MKFTQAYAGGCVCAPSRCSLLTGLHLGHAWVRNNNSIRGRQEPIPSEEVTVAELLRDAGYTCAMIGKWGIGPPGTDGAPEKQGFDYSYGFYHQLRAHNYYPEFIWKNGEKVHLKANERFDYIAIKKASLTDDYNQLFDEEGILKPPGVEDSREIQNTMDLCYQEAMKFIKENKDKPFFLYLAYQPPHGTLVVPSLKPYTHEDWPSWRHKIWAALVTRMDKQIGDIVSLLKELNIDSNTVVFISSDNGYSACGYWGEDYGRKVDAIHYKSFFDNKGPFRGGKSNLYEGGLRVPLIAWWPGTIKADSKSDQVCAFWDFLPTACDIAGVETPENIDGISILPTLLGKDSQTQHQYLYWEHNHSQAVRMGKWKGYRPHPQKSIQLYNLEEDIRETNDLSVRYPEIVERIERIFTTARDESPLYIDPGQSDEEEWIKKNSLKYMY
jgi:arylsulfatase A-like enzyme